MSQEPHAMLAPAEVLQPIHQLSLAVDHYTRYPSEPLTLYTRFTAPEQPGAVLQIVLPHVIQVESYQPAEVIRAAGAALVEAGQQRILQIPLDPALQPGQVCDFEVQTRIQTIYFDHYLVIEARLLDDAGLTLATESLQVAIFRKASYLQHLPELYERDDFINRFLMLFESFWQPIRRQIDQADCYYDPGLTPDAFVPWLSSWIGLPVDDSLPTERIRALLGSAMMFYQCRGTAHALKTYLEIYTGGQVTIIEKRSRNLVLGAGGVLGVEMALGLNNHPNRIIIRACVPAEELARTQFTPQMYHQKLREIARQMVPAHAEFEVQCDFQEPLPLLAAEQRIES